MISQAGSKETIPVHEHNGIRFVVVADIPEPGRSEFLSWLAWQQVPIVPDFGDVAYVWDWERWKSIL